MMPFDARHLLEAAGGEMVGKVRLQKSVYLLDQLGMNSGFSYDYHHYGPYSEELADDVETDIIFGFVTEDVRHRVGDGVPYSVFRPTELNEPNETDELGNLPFEDARNALATMENYTATVLELAATTHWLSVVEEVEDWRGELVRRKGVKTKQGRIDEALKLLTELGLEPQA